MDRQRHVWKPARTPRKEHGRTSRPARSPFHPARSAARTARPAPLTADRNAARAPSPGSPPPRGNPLDVSTHSRARPGPRHCQAGPQPPRPAPSGAAARGPAERQPRGPALATAAVAPSPPRPARCTALQRPLAAGGLKQEPQGGAKCESAPERKIFYLRIYSVKSYT